MLTLGRVENRAGEVVILRRPAGRQFNILLDNIQFLQKKPHVIAYVWPKNGKTNIYSIASLFSETIAALSCPEMLSLEEFGRDGLSNSTSTDSF